MLLSMYIGTTYAQCFAPKFEPFKYEQDNVDTSSWISLSVGPGIASLKIPADFTNLSVTEEGSLIFSRGNTTDFRGIVIFEKTGDYQENPGISKNIQPFYKKMLTAPEGSYCDYLETFKLESQEYLFHIQLEGGEVYAFGKENKHRFYILIDKKPDIIITGGIQNINLNYFKNILNSIQLKG